MTNVRRALRFPAAALACLLAAGCVTVPPPTATETVDDPCAERLHRLCEYIVLYYAARHELPPNARALADMFGADVPPCVSPRSGENYSFLPGTVVIPGRPGRLFILDPAPATIAGHAAKWAILASETPRKDSLVTQVVPLGERELSEALRPR